jgi:hypothetical protein
MPAVVQTVLSALSAAAAPPVAASPEPQAIEGGAFALAFADLPGSPTPIVQRDEPAPQETVPEASLPPPLWPNWAPPAPVETTAALPDVVSEPATSSVEGAEPVGPVWVGKAPVFQGVVAAGTEVPPQSGPSIQDSIPNKSGYQPPQGALQPAELVSLRPSPSAERVVPATAPPGDTPEIPPEQPTAYGMPPEKGQIAPQPTGLPAPQPSRQVAAAGVPQLAEPKPMTGELPDHSVLETQGETALVGSERTAELDPIIPAARVDITRNDQPASPEVTVALSQLLFAAKVSKSAAPVDVRGPEVGLPLGKMPETADPLELRVPVANPTAGQSLADVAPANPSTLPPAAPEVPARLSPTTPAGIVFEAVSQGKAIEPEVPEEASDLSEPTPIPVEATRSKSPPPDRLPLDLSVNPVMDVEAFDALPDLGLEPMGMLTGMSPFSPIGLAADPASGPTRTATPTAQAALAAPLLQVLSGPKTGTTEIALSPEELGHVQLSFRENPSDPDRLVLAMAFERPDVMDLFRRHADQLLAEIRAAGYSGVDLSFSQSGAEGWKDQTQGQPTPSGSEAWTEGKDTAAIAVVTAGASLAPSSSLDLRL